MPLRLGCDLTRIDDFTLNLLTNDEVLAVDQDPLGKQADKVYEKDDIQYWIKPLADGSWAAGIFNLGEKRQKVQVTFAGLKLDGKNYRVRDLWRQKNLGSFKNSINLKLMPHGVLLLKIAKNDNW